MTTDALGAATSIAARIATALGDGKIGGRGIFGVELFVKGDDVYFSESVRARTTPVWSPWPPSDSANSRCTHAPSSGCRST